MSPRFRPAPLAAAAALAVAAFCGAVARAAVPVPATTAAQLAAMPTSPSFKMGVAKGENGAPEATAVVAKPIDMKAGEAFGRPGAASGAAAKPGEKAGEKPGDRAGARAQAKVGADAVEPGKGAKKPSNEAMSSGSKPEAAGESRHEAKAGANAAPEKAAPPDPMETLRQKLAEKLGAKSSPDGKFVMRVSTHGESGENVITAVRPTAAALAGARRTAARHAAHAASTPASDNPEMNANVAAYAGSSLLPTRWDYTGTIGPEAWSRLKPEFGKCASGTRQSPIDIRGGIAVDLEPIQFDYRASAFSVVDNGHTVQVNVEPGNAITVMGRRYELVEFHFHRPSEERINGRQFDMVAHLVHKDAEGHLAVVAVLLDRGSAQAVVQSVWNNLPLEKGDEVRAGVKLDLSQLLPQDRRYYTYMGSMTTPPCSEGVLWMVMKQPVPISPEQVSVFSRLYPMNARPIQQADGRLIKESN